MDIVGILGRKGSGKDTVGDYLAEHHGFTKIAFAAKVKNVCLDLFPCLMPEDLNGTQERKERTILTIGASPRTLMQLVGTEAGREMRFGVLQPYGISPARLEEALRAQDVEPGEDCWIDGLLDPQRGRLAEDGKYVVTDTRFPNEARALIQRKHRVLKLIRPGYTTGQNENHASEQMVDRCPYTHLVWNDETIETLHRRVSALLQLLHVQ